MLLCLRCCLDARKLLRASQCAPAWPSDLPSPSFHFTPPTPHSLTHLTENYLATPINVNQFTFPFLVGSSAFPRPPRSLILLPFIWFLPRHSDPSPWPMQCVSPPIWGLAPDCLSAPPPSLAGQTGRVIRANWDTLTIHALKGAFRQSVSLTVWAVSFSNRRETMRKEESRQYFWRSFYQSLTGHPGVWP